MKKYKIVLLPQAQMGINDIVDYLREEASENVAKKVKKEILATIRKLEIFPASHSKVLELSDERTIYRRILVYSYRIIFTIQEDVLKVLIVDIDHGARDPKKLTTPRN